jgi:hypothetical protein
MFQFPQLLGFQFQPNLPHHRFFDRKKKFSFINVTFCATIFCYGLTDRPIARCEQVSHVVDHSQNNARKYSNTNCFDRAKIIREYSFCKTHENFVIFDFEQGSCDFENRTPAIRIIRIRFPALLRIYPAELEVIYQEEK